MYFILGSILLLLTLILLIWAIIDVFKKGKSKSIILLLLFTPIIGPILYFQNHKK